MQSLGLQLADAIVAELNAPARGWALPFTAARLWRPVEKMEDLATLQVAVVPVTRDTIDLTQTGNTRTKRRYDFSIVIDFQQQADGSQVATIDALVNLIDRDITGFYADLHYLQADSLPANVWYVTEVGYVGDSLYHMDRLYQEGVFEAALVLSVRGYA